MDKHLTAASHVMPDSIWSETPVCRVMLDCILLSLTLPVHRCALAALLEPTLLPTARPTFLHVWLALQEHIPILWAPTPSLRASHVFPELFLTLPALPRLQHVLDVTLVLLLLSWVQSLLARVLPVQRVTGQELPQEHVRLVLLEHGLMSLPLLLAPLVINVVPECSRAPLLQRLLLFALSAPLELHLLRWRQLPLAHV
jgi:hypothetical protein